jgi:hypothetical protein
MPSLGRNQNFLTAEELMNRWGISALDLIAILSEEELQIWDSKNLTICAYDDRILNVNCVDTMAFELIDVKRYEEKHPEYKPQEDPKPEPLDGKDRRKFGQLKREKLKWDESLKVAVHIGIFCSKKKERTVKRKMVWDEVYSNFSLIEDATIERIWTAIPDKYRKGPGAPQKDS